MRWTLLVVFAAACTQPADGADLDAIFEGIVRNRASIEFPCAPDQLAIQDLEGEAFRATGCGAYATYECEYSYTDSDNTNGDYLYVCKRAAEDGPERIDAGM